jgi:hypothetical protein
VLDPAFPGWQWQPDEIRRLAGRAADLVAEALWLGSDMNDYHRTEIIAESGDLGDHTGRGSDVSATIVLNLRCTRQANFTVDVVDEPRVTDLVGYADELVVAALRTQPVFLLMRVNPN